MPKRKREEEGMDGVESAAESDGCPDARSGMFALLKYMRCICSLCCALLPKNFNFNPQFFNLNHI